MVDDRLSNSLISRGYQRLNSNSQGIYMFFCIEGNDLILVSVIHAVSGTEITRPQYLNILDQIKTNFKKTYPQQLRLLSLILTNYPERVRSLFSEVEEDSHWIIDTNEHRLIIYETQPTEFAGLRDPLDQILEEEQRQQPQNEASTNYRNRGQDQYSELHQDREQNQDQYQNEYQNNYQDPSSGQYARSYRDQMQGVRSPKLKLFTLMNTIIIAVNIIAYIVLHYTGAFGGEDQMISGGALSWYFVKEENQYYRLLSSMFMHADFDHLFNNMLVLLFVGDNLERAAGKFKYLLLYFGTGILAGITSISYNMWKDYANFSYEYSAFSIGASGAIFGVVGAVLYIVIVNKGRLEDISSRQMVLFVVFSLYGGISNARIDQAAHVGGFMAGILLAAILYRRPRRNSEVQEM
jgi:rhomboid protease GluP